jgi:hypothetical protein
MRLNANGHKGSLEDNKNILNWKKQKNKKTPKKPKNKVFAPHSLPNTLSLLSSPSHWYQLSSPRQGLFGSPVF